MWRERWGVKWREVVVLRQKGKGGGEVEGKVRK